MSNGTTNKTPAEQYAEAVKQLQEAQGKLGADSIDIKQSSPFIEGLLQAYGPQMAANLASPIDARGGVNQYGQSYGSFLPSMQGQNQLQQQAIQQLLNQQGYGQAEFGPGGEFTGIKGATAKNPYGSGTGIASYQPFLNQAATDLNAASAAAAAGQGAGAGALEQAQQAYNAAQAAAAAGQNAGAQFMGPGAYKQFMDPYQKQVIDASLAQFDKKSGEQARAAGLAAARGSAFGTERFGVQEGSRQAQSNLDRASMTANMLSQGYQQAKQAANTAFQQAQAQALQNMNLYGQAGQGQQNLAQGLQGQAAQNLGLFQSSAQGQQGMAKLQPALAGQGIAALGQMGAQQQAQGQAALDTAAKGNQMIAYQPQQGLGFFGSQLTGLMGGYGTPNTFSSVAPDAGTSPMSMLLSGIGAGANIGNLFGYGS